MSDKPTTGEQEWKLAQYAAIKIHKDGNSSQRARARVIILEAINAALAAERKGHEMDGQLISSQEAQLAAERKKVQTLVDALTSVRAKIRLHNETITQRVTMVTEIIDAALAKIGGGK